jgi:hypothetical protein
LMSLRPHHRSEWGSGGCRRPWFFDGFFVPLASRRTTEAGEPSTCPSTRTIPDCDRALNPPPAPRACRPLPYLGSADHRPTDGLGPCVRSPKAICSERIVWRPGSRGSPTCIPPMRDPNPESPAQDGGTDRVRGLRAVRKAELGAITLPYNQSAVIKFRADAVVLDYKAAERARPGRRSRRRRWSRRGRPQVWERRRPM